MEIQESLEGSLKHVACDGEPPIACTETVQSKSQVLAPSPLSPEAGQLFWLLEPMQLVPTPPTPTPFPVPEAVFLSGFSVYLLSSMAGWQLWLILIVNSYWSRDTQMKFRVSVKVFPGKTHISICRLAKTDHPPQCGWHHPVCERTRKWDLVVVALAGPKPGPGAFLETRNFIQDQEFHALGLASWVL